MYKRQVRIVDFSKEIGKQVKRGETFSILKPGKKVKGLQTYDVITGYKSTIKELSRASGEIPISRVKVIELPIVDATTEKSFSISLAKIKKTPLQKTFSIKDLASIKFNLYSPAPPAKTPKLKVTQTSPTKVSAPLMAGGVGYSKLTSNFAKTSVTEFSLEKKQSLIKPAVKQKDILSTKVGDSFNFRVKTKLLLNNLTKQNFDVSQIIKQGQKIRQRNKQQQLQKVGEVGLTSIRPLIPFFSFTEIKSQPSKPKIPFRLKFKLKKPKVSRKVGKYPVQVRRFGKWRTVGFGKSPLEALGIGKRVTSQTLAASFKVPKFKGTKVPGYKTKKTKEGTIFIEPEKKRLKRGTKEIPEIQFYRGLKGGKR